MNKSGRIRNKLLNHLLDLLYKSREQSVISSKFAADLLWFRRSGKRDLELKTLHFHVHSVYQQIQMLRKRLHLEPMLALTTADRVFVTSVVIRDTSAFPAERSANANVIPKKTVYREKCSTGEAQ